MIGIALFATFSILTLLIWALDYNFHEEEENTSGQVEMHNEKKVSSLQNITRAQKLGIVATVILLVSVLSGLLGGFLPKFRRGTCRVASVEDCTEFQKNFPNCKVKKPFLIGDGKCNGGEYNAAECNYDNGDCFKFNTNYTDCDVNHPFWIGDGYCQGGKYNTKECGFDGGDCLDFNQKYPNCTLYELPFPFGGVLGYGWCINWYNTEECGWENGDCVPRNDN